MEVELVTLHKILDKKPQQTFINTNTRKGCEICSELTTETLEIDPRYSSGVFIVNFNDISHLFLLFLLLNWSMYLFAGGTLL